MTDGVQHRALVTSVGSGEAAGLSDQGWTDMKDSGALDAQPAVEMPLEMFDGMRISRVAEYATRRGNSFTLFRLTCPIHGTALSLRLSGRAFCSDCL